MNAHPVSSGLMLRLQGLARLKSLSLRTRILGWGLSGVILLLLCWGVLDMIFVMRPSVRAVGFVMVTGVLAFTLWKWAKAMSHRADGKEAALDAEGRDASFSTVVSTTAEYEQHPERTLRDPVSQSWVGIMSARAGEMLTRYRPPYLKQLGIAGFVFLCALAALTVYLAVLPEGGMSLARILPWTNQSYTRIEMMTDAEKVPLRSDYLIQAEVSGRKPDAVILHYKPHGEGASQQIIMEEIEPGIFAYEIPRVEKSFTYSITAADGKIPIRNVTAFEAPRIEEFIIRITPPDYAGKEAFTLGAPDVSILRGSRVDYRIKTSPRLTKVTQLRERVEFPEAGKILSQGRFDEVLYADGLEQWWTAWVSDEPAEYFYAIVLSDHLDQTVTNGAPYRFSFVADQAPKVEIAEPGKDIAANPGMKIPVKANAKDDYTVTKMRLIYNKLGETPRTNVLQNISKDGSKWIASGEIDLGTLNLKDYELVAYHVEAEDNNSLDGPGIGRSQTYFIEITNEKAALCQGGGGGQSSREKVNLLESQKNIISTANQLIERKEQNQAETLAVSQKVVREYAGVYLDAMKKMKLPDVVLDKMGEAIGHMNESEGNLRAGDIPTAIISAQKALANLYQVVHLTPGNRPVVMGESAGDDQNVAILLEAIKQYGKAEDQEIQNELRKIIEEAKQLARMEESVSAGRHPGSSGHGGKKKGKGSGHSAAALTPEEKEIKDRAERLAERIKLLSEKDARIKKDLANGLLQGIGEFVSPPDEPQEGGGLLSGAFAMPNENFRRALETILIELGRVEKNFRAGRIYNDEYPLEFQPYVEDYFRKLTREE